jgi:myo-inositol 2-dehydrogenase/D-chiro-inositol 1-dehydrogenase
MVTIAIFGAGRIGQLHAKHAAEHPDISIGYVVDPIAANAAAVAAVTGASIADAERVFADRAVDGVVIASSTDSHADLVQRAAVAGKAVFCEKPLSLDLRTAESCVRVLDREGARCMLGFHRRYDLGFRTARERIRDGKAGEVYQLVLFGRSGSGNLPSVDYIKVSGGLFRDQSIHDFDMVRYLLGEEIATVYAVGGCLVYEAIGAAGDIDTAMITMVSRSGKLVQINNAKYNPFGFDQRVEVLASNEVLRVENVPLDTVVIGTREGFKSASSVGSFLGRYAAAYRAEMDAFAQLIAEGKAPLADHHDGLEAQRLAEAAVRSLREGRPVVP